MAKKRCGCQKFEINDSVLINGKTFYYKCNCKEHTPECVTQEMVDALSEEVYSNSVTK